MCIRTLFPELPSPRIPFPYIMSQDQCSIKHSLGNAGLIGPGTLPFHSEITFCACSVPQLCPLFTTPWTVAHQPPLSMEFFRQEYWSGAIFPSKGSSWSRDQTCTSSVSCIGKWILYHCATWESWDNSWQTDKWKETPSSKDHCGRMHKSLASETVKSGTVLWFCP